MNNFWLLLSLVGTFLALLFLPLGVIHLLRKRQGDKRRSPLTQMLLRAPGESLRKELDDASDELMLNMLMLPIAPLLVYSLHISQSYFLGVKESFLRISIAVLFGISAIAYFLFAILKQLKRANKLRLGYDGEVAIAQELNLLMRDGAYVFHDVPADGFNIDHVIVWPKGVYAVETKCRMKPNRDRGKEDAQVIFDGQRLRFPGWSETEPLNQAARQAKWLAQWLSSAVGENVGVKPVLALPGWYVEKNGKSDVVIINGRNAADFFSKFFHFTLNDEMVGRIKHQLEQRCRDVEPKYFNKREKFPQ